MIETIRQLFVYDFWSNARILAALRSTPHHHQEASRLLAHLLVSEKIWLLRVEGENTAAINKSPELSIVQCADLASENQKGFARLLSSASEDSLRSLVTYKNFKGTEFQTPVGEILLHVALHGTYHRGQIAKAMREEGDTPVDTDFITFVHEQSAR